MEYKTKAAMKIIMKLTVDEALELMKELRKLEDKTHGIWVLSSPKKAAIDVLDSFIEDIGVSLRLMDPMKDFVRLMVEERVPEHEFVWEYNKALSHLLQCDLLKPDA